jgi:hypothetical protein
MARAITRYNVASESGDTRMEPSAEGEYVEYTDHQLIVLELELRIHRLVNAVSEIHEKTGGIS